MVALSPIHKAIPFVRSHFTGIMGKKPWTFAWQVALEAVVLEACLSAAISSLFPKAGNDPFAGMPFWTLAIGAILFAPIAETFLFQSIPIAIARQFGRTFQAQVVWSMVPFALFHVLQMGWSGAGPGLVGGFYLAFSYAVWKRKDPGKAFVVTAGIHLIHNAAAVLLQLVMP
ncbi:MAG TPA: CPBP family glutamic-type intramembrane protease [bacterium]